MTIRKTLLAAAILSLSQAADAGRRDGSSPVRGEREAAFGGKAGDFLERPTPEALAELLLAINAPEVDDKEAALAREDWEAVAVALLDRGPEPRELALLNHPALIEDQERSSQTDVMPRRLWRKDSPTFLRAQKLWKAFPDRDKRVLLPKIAREAGAALESALVRGAVQNGESDGPPVGALSTPTAQAALRRASEARSSDELKDPPAAEAVDPEREQAQARIAGIAQGFASGELHSAVSSLTDFQDAFLPRRHELLRPVLAEHAARAAKALAEAKDPDAEFFKQLASNAVSNRPVFKRVSGGEVIRRFDYAFGDKNYAAAKAGFAQAGTAKTRRLWAESVLRASFWYIIGGIMVGYLIWMIGTGLGSMEWTLLIPLAFLIFLDLYKHPPERMWRHAVVRTALENGLLGRSSGPALADQRPADRARPASSRHGSSPRHEEDIDAAVGRLRDGEAQGVEALGILETLRGDWRPLFRSSHMDAVWDKGLDSGDPALVRSAALTLVSMPNEFASFLVERRIEFGSEGMQAFLRAVRALPPDARGFMDGLLKALNIRTPEDLPAVGLLRAALLKPASPQSEPAAAIVEEGERPPDVVARLAAGERIYRPEDPHFDIDKLTADNLGFLDEKDGVFAEYPFRTGFGRQRGRYLLGHPLTEAEDIVKRQDAVAALWGDPELRENDLRERVSDALSRFGNSVDEKLWDHFFGLRKYPLNFGALRRMSTIALLAVTGSLAAYFMGFPLQHAIPGIVLPFILAVSQWGPASDKLPGLRGQLRAYKSAFELGSELAGPLLASDSAALKEIGRMLQAADDPRHPLGLKPLADSFKRVSTNGRAIGFDLLYGHSAWTLPRLIRDFERDREKVAAYLGALAELDAYLAMADNARVRKYSRPKALDLDRARLRVIGLHHPWLLERGISKPNDLTLSSEPGSYNLGILTAGNALGKTTILKAAMLALLRAQIGDWVSARSMEWVPGRFMASMNIKDDLINSRSTFVAEGRRMAEIFELARSPRFYAFMDEVLHGTSPRLSAAVLAPALEKLAGTGGGFILATHFRELATLGGFKPRGRSVWRDYTEEERAALRRVPGVGNIHMADGYRLLPGPADDFNALEVLDRIPGFPKDVIEAARAILRDYDRASKP